MILTVVALGWLSWSAYKNYESVAEIAGRLKHLERLRGNIMHLDEVLTMSARMAISTGETAWIKHYQKYCK